MARASVNGRRVMPNVDDGALPILAAGDYGRLPPPANPKVGSRTGWWHVCAPDGSTKCLNPNVYQVKEHEDGTISVTPSIDFSVGRRRPPAYHGFLTKGVWS